jgi:NAD(P)-dependent dehydrogenase (short-subunit alcohol dehydrogenase family)
MSDVPQQLIDQYVQEHQLIKRQGKMTDLANALLFFCSEDASFITGETLLVAGGHPLRI